MELVLRCLLEPSLHDVFDNYFNLFDLLAILPFWASWAFQGRYHAGNSIIMDACMSLRILRMLKLARHFQGTIVRRSSLLPFPLPLLLFALLLN